MTEVLIRDEAPEDIEAVRHVNDAAFAQDGEGRLVDELRRQGAAVVSLVAEVEGRIVGHILFSPVTIDGASRPDGIVGLAPMAVLPEHQRHGIGGRLIRAGLDRCRGRGASLAVVLGHPEYYPRFGFVPAPPLGVTSRPRRGLHGPGAGAGSPGGAAWAGAVPRGVCGGLSRGILIWARRAPARAGSASRDLPGGRLDR